MPILQFFGLIIGSGLIVKSFHSIFIHRFSDTTPQRETHGKKVASLSSAPQPKDQSRLLVQTFQGHIKDLKKIMADIPNISADIERFFHDRIAEAHRELQKHKATVRTLSPSPPFSPSEKHLMEKYKIAKLREMQEKLNAESQIPSAERERVRDFFNEKINEKINKKAKTKSSQGTAKQQVLGPRAGESSTSRFPGESSTSRGVRSVTFVEPPQPIGPQNPNGGGAPWSWFTIRICFISLQFNSSHR